MPSLDPRNFLNRARRGKTYGGPWCDHYARRLGDVGWICAEMAGPLAGGYPDGGRTFYVLFSDRHVRGAKHRP